MGGDLSDEVLVLLLRSAVTSPDAAQRLKAIFQEQLVHALGDPADLADPADPAEVLRRAGLIASQTFCVALGRYLLELPGLADQPTIRRYLNLPLPTPKPEDAPSPERSVEDPQMTIVEGVVGPPLTVSRLGRVLG